MLCAVGIFTRPLVKPFISSLFIDVVKPHALRSGCKLSIRIERHLFGGDTLNLQPFYIPICRVGKIATDTESEERWRYATVI